MRSAVKFMGRSVFTMFLVVLGLNSVAVQAGDDKYLLQAGDLIEVSVWKEQDLQRELLVTPDGMISFPLVGHMQAQGLSVQDLNKHIIEKLSKYIPDPSVTVLLRSTAGSRFFVIGKVNRPGQYPMQQPTSILQALSVAGGTTTYASTDDIKVIRRNNTEAISFSYDDIKNGEELEQNILLSNGDVVVVP